MDSDVVNISTSFPPISGFSWNLEPKGLKLLETEDDMGAGGTSSAAARGKPKASQKTKEQPRSSSPDPSQRAAERRSPKQQDKKDGKTSMLFKRPKRGHISKLTMEVLRWKVSETEGVKPFRVQPSSPLEDPASQRKLRAPARASRAASDSLPGVSKRGSEPLSQLHHSNPQRPWPATAGADMPGTQSSRRRNLSDAIHRASLLGGMAPVDSRPLREPSPGRHSPQNHSTETSKRRSLPSRASPVPSPPGPSPPVSLPPNYS
eukprot:RCo019653